MLWIWFSDFCFVSLESTILFSVYQLASNSHLLLCLDGHLSNRLSMRSEGKHH